MSEVRAPVVAPTHPTQGMRRDRSIVLVLGTIAWFAAMLVSFRFSAAGGFAWHMALHLLNVALVAPLASLATRACRPRRLPAPLVAAFIELLVVWGWHAPAAHAFARTELGGFLLEQASFVACAYLLWAAVLDAVTRRDQGAIAQSVLALLLTSMHMSLLGGVLALAAGNPYRADLCGSAASGLGPMADLQLGGVLMLGFAASVYLVAALLLARRLLGAHQA